MQTLCLLGRQPKLGLAELEAVFGPQALTVISRDTVLVKGRVDLSRFGGIIKAAAFLTPIESIDLQKLIRFCAQALPEHIADIPEGKIKLGLSFYGFDFSPRAIGAGALELKKVIKKQGRSVRVIPNPAAALNSAQVLHNQLTSPLGLELIFVKHGTTTYLGQTTAVQNIEDYTLRDRGRPKRDAYVGMLPPKLAQIMINLATGNEASLASQRDVSLPTILDPFCGTGVVLQEAALLGYDVYGSDLSQRMIDYSEANLDWLRRTYNLSFDSTLETGDATTHTWTTAFTHVAGETYLGQPLLALPSPDKLKAIMRGCDELHTTFLRNLAAQTKPGTRICLAVPAWRVKGGFYHLKTLDDLENLGYNRLDFVNAATSDLIYHREDQIVARELVIITRK